jgi:hypothetical protein
MSARRRFRRRMTLSEQCEHGDARLAAGWRPEGRQGCASSTRTRRLTVDVVERPLIASVTLG